jgi:hypothetical protein
MDEAAWQDTIRREEEDRAQKQGKQVVLAVHLSWIRPEDGIRTHKEDYATVKGRLPAGSGLLIGTGGVQRGLMEAVLLLRGQLATVGELEEWFDLKDGAGGKYVEVSMSMPKGSLEEFLSSRQARVEGLEFSAGSRINVQRGEAEMQDLLTARTKGNPYDSDGQTMKLLTEMMRCYRAALS